MIITIYYLCYYVVRGMQECQEIYVDTFCNVHVDSWL